MTDDPIRLTGIRFARGGRTIFDGLDLTIPPGRSTALVAPSGAGKSTLLALIAGLVEPDAGHVTTPFTAAETGLVLQAYGLAGLLTAAENIEVALQARRGLRRAEIRRRAAQVLEQVHLTAVADHLVEELSGGQQQRVAVARALAIRPRLLIADEFTAELDRSNRDETADLVFNAATHGTTVIIATHDRGIAERCDVVHPTQRADLTHPLQLRSRSALPRRPRPHARACCCCSCGALRPCGGDAQIGAWLTRRLRTVPGSLTPRSAQVRRS